MCVCVCVCIKKSMHTDLDYQIYTALMAIAQDIKEQYFELRIHTCITYPSSLHYKMNILSRTLRLMQFKKNWSTKKRIIM